MEYTKKVKIPKFEPNDENIDLEDCINVDKYLFLLRDIDLELKNKEITENEAKFLKLCATRWIKFNYENVAQYYATKSSPAFQRCLEKSAMVLIDINKAFESSIVKSKQYIEKITNEYMNENVDNYNDIDLKEKQSI